MRDKYSQLSSAYHYAWLILIFQSREAAISFELIPSYFLSNDIISKIKIPHRQAYVTLADFGLGPLVLLLPKF
jgi:hypothetical protein